MLKVSQKWKKKSITYIKITTTSTVCTSSTKIKQMNNPLPHTTGKGWINRTYFKKEKHILEFDTSIAGNFLNDTA